jgi:putative FmdB family regulatory protein
MPIYAYRCESCGHAKDVLQKVSDPLLTTCPACGAESFKKQLTAAGFQLKGSGWYVTDFRNGNGGAKTEAATGAPAVVPKSDDAATPAAGQSDTAAASAPTTAATSGGDSGPASGSGSPSASA